MKFNSDIDIDFADRSKILDKIKYCSASIINDNSITKHNTGIYVTDMPVDPFTGTASLDYRQAEDRGYIKLDFLNVNVYNLVRDEKHLLELMNVEPPWHRLLEKSFCEQLIHIGNHYNSIVRMPESITSIDHLAMFLAIIRPSKRYLIGKSWGAIESKVWEKESQEDYQFKKSHSIAYSHLVVVHMNLLNNSSN
jgi:hypothetical protein